MFEDYMNGGTLTEFIYQFKNSYNEETMAYVLREILEGLNAIHNNHHIHRDLKSDNILIDRNGGVFFNFEFRLKLVILDMLPS